MRKPKAFPPVNSRPREYFGAPQGKYVAQDIGPYLKSIGKIPIFSREEKEEEKAGRELSAARAKLLKSVRAFAVPVNEQMLQARTLLQKPVSISFGRNHRLEKVENIEDVWNFILVFQHVYGYWPPIDRIKERYAPTPGDLRVISHIRLEDLAEEIRLWQLLERLNAAGKRIESEKIKKQFVRMNSRVFENIVREFKNPLLRKYWHARVFDEIESIPVLPKSVRVAFRVLLGVEGKFVNANVRWAVSTAKKYFQRCFSAKMDFNDVIQEGNLGLHRAVRRFHPERGFRFCTFATPWIEQTIQRALDNNFNTIRIPIHLLEKYKRIDTMSQQLGHELGREPTVEELAKALSEFGLTEEKIREVLQNVRSVDSLDRKVNQQQQEDSDSVLEDFIHDASAPSPEETMLAANFEDTIDAVCEKLLTDQERFVINLRFGRGGETEHTLQEVGDRLSLSRERIRQIEANALRKLRRKKEMLTDFLAKN